MKGEQNMSDYLIRALAFDGKVRAYAIRSTESVAEAQRRHNTWPVVSAALGRAMTATAMMGAMLKGEDKLTVKIEGDGPIGAIIVDGNSKGEIRGYVKNPHVHFDLNEQGKLDVRRAVGTNGFLTVVKDLGMRDHFSGQVPLVSGEIGDDFTYYFASSEQIPSAVGVGVIVNPDNTIKAAGGFIIQLMPGTEEEVISFIEKRIKEVPSISALINEGHTPEEILYKILGEKEVEILDKVFVNYKCHCSKERVATAITGLGEEEIKKIIEEEGQAEAHCHFCNEKYTLNKKELEELLEQMK